MFQFSLGQHWVLGTMKEEEKKRNKTTMRSFCHGKTSKHLISLNSPECDLKLWRMMSEKFIM